MGRGQGGASLIFLVEKKNKERFLSAHNIKHGKTLTLDEEFTSYDKVNVLGEGVTHIAADVNSAEPTVYSVSNLLRKLRLEDGGTNLKPTIARATVPAEGQDGTISMAVQPSSRGKGKNQTATVVVSFKTKSASKNKYMIEWYQAKKDDLTCQKCPVKLGEHSEPAILLADPKDARAVYGLFINRSNSTTTLHKLTKGRKHEDAIATFNFEVDLATIGMSADQNVTLLIYESGREYARVYTLQKTEGFRGRHPICATCSPLELISSPSHVISCAVQRWQLPIALVDQHLSSGNVQMALVTLLDQSSGRYVTEPDSVLPYRLRVLACDTQGFSSVAIALEDMERIFENAEEKLMSATLKICLNQRPCKDSMSQLSAWLMSGRLANVELYYIKSGNVSAVQTGSDRMVVKPISSDLFRGYVTDTDWTQMNQRQGTFTLDNDEGAGNKSKIPRMSSSMPPSQLATTNGRESTTIPNASLETMASSLSECLSKIQTDQLALNSNIESMKNALDNLQGLIQKQKDANNVSELADEEEIEEAEP